MAVEFQDYYSRLGVSRNASPEEINKAYRRLARKYHPDVCTEPDAEEQFKKVNEAHAVLSDPEKRRKYDALGENWEQGADFSPPPGWGGFQFNFGGGPRTRHTRTSAGGEHPFGEFGEFSDFFEAFFGGAGGMNAQQPTRMRGQDHNLELTITLEDAMRGTTKTIALQSQEPRPDGRLHQHTKNINVTIPAGVKDGSKIRLAGQGTPSHPRGAPGDLYLRVHIAPHPKYQLSGHDLTTCLELSPWEAVLGAKVPVKTLDETVMLTVPPGTDSGQRLRLKGKGLPKRDHQRGDLFVEIKIVLPKQLSSQERELFQQLAQVSQFNPRAS